MFHLSTIAHENTSCHANAHLKIQSCKAIWGPCDTGKVNVPGKTKVGDDGWTPWEDSPRGVSTPYICFISHAHPCLEKFDE